METWRALERAADAVRERGWWQKDTYNTTSESVCISFACDVPDNAARWSAKYALAIAVGADPQNVDIKLLHQWNDAPGRTKEEVIALILAVAASEKARAARLLPVVREQVTA